MKTPIDYTYDICRMYIADNALLLGELGPKLLGKTRNRDLAFLAGCGDLFNPEYHGLDVFRILRQVQAFFKKNEHLSLTSRCDAAALEAFDKAERQCRKTNDLLYYRFIQRDHHDPDLDKKVVKMERYIKTVLGPFRPFLEELPVRVKVTGGATATTSKLQSKVHLKVRKKISAATGAVKYLESLNQYFGYGPLKVLRHDVNRVVFVPKNWKTSRTIACEPTGNVPLQLAFDSYAKERLTKVGIDLSNQNLNQSLATRGSIDGSFATIDLEAASDTVALSLVMGLFPHDWLEYLRSVRSSHFVHPSTKRLTKYEKFSSMGNGSTFAIETLIFAAACNAVGCGKGQFSVYGDDIAVETEFAHPLIALLVYLGFNINKEKSYLKGPFRESCGNDRFLGVDVTPFYLRKWSGDHKTVLAHNVNGLASIATPDGQLEKFLLSTSRELPLVPYSEATTHGLFIDVHSAYDLKLIHFGYYDFAERRFVVDWIPRVRGLITKVRKAGSCWDSRGLFLWFLEKGIACRIDSQGVVRSSTVPAEPSGKYRTGWGVWYPSRTKKVPAYLYRWSDLVVRYRRETEG